MTPEDEEPIEEDISEPVEEDIFVDSGDAASVRRATKRARTWHAQKRQFSKAILATENGRRWIWEFLSLECNFGAVTIANSTAGVPDPMATMYWAGAQRIGMRLFEMLQRADHEAVYIMRVENDPAYAELRPKGRR